MKTKSTLLFGAYGSFEEATVKKWKRLRVLSHKPSGNLSSLSTIYTDHQKAMKLLVTGWKAYYDLYSVGYQEWEKIKGAFAEFIKDQMINYVDFGTPGSPVWLPYGGNVSLGSMPITELTMGTLDAGAQTAIIGHSTVPGYKQNSGDKLAGLFYNYTQDKISAQVGFSIRSDASSGVTLQAGFMSPGDSIQFAGFFYGSAGTPTFGKTSNTQVVNGTAV